MSTTVLIIDDEEPLRKLLSRVIALEGYSVLEADSLKAGSAVLHRRQADVVLCDVKLPDGSGVDFVKVISDAFPLTEVIVLTAYGNVADGVQAMKNGAFDYVEKGTDNDRILPLLAQAAERSRTQRSAAMNVGRSEHHRFENIIGRSSLLQQAIDFAKRIAPTDVNVLLLGETGTGKEVFAGAIHAASRRAAGQLVAINCSAFPRDLLEGELFGHRAGAFTGATKDKKGLFQVADGGTLFLDEIGETQIDLQAKLLRVLETGSFFRLGDEKPSHVDTRIIAATNRHLKTEIESGRFREDLFYRINGFTIQLPPLRERQEDIADLASYFLKRFSEKQQLPAVQIEPEALRILRAHAWKGNIRELKNVIERAALLAEGEVVTPRELPYELQKHSSSPSPGLSLAAVEQEHIARVLQVAGGNKTRAAALLGIGLTTLYRKIEEYHLH